MTRPTRPIPNTRHLITRGHQYRPPKPSSWRPGPHSVCAWSQAVCRRVVGVIRSGIPGFYSSRSRTSTEADISSTSAARLPALSYNRSDAKASAAPNQPVGDDHHSNTWLLLLPRGSAASSWDDKRSSVRRGIVQSLFVQPENHSWTNLTQLYIDLEATHTNEKAERSSWLRARGSPSSAQYCCNRARRFQ
jgi:hypothetical protein